MRNGKYCIAVMSVGSGVGQSVINSCKLSQLPLHTVGFGMNPFAYGAYDCDTMDYVPLIYAENYVDELVRKCHEHDIDLIIPGSDDEAHILSRNIERIESEGFKVLVSGVNLLDLVRDKERMCDDLTPIADIFVKSYDIHTIKEALAEKKVDFPLIAKPRAGFASRGVEILLSEDDFVRVNENHIIQELAVPRQGDPLREAYLKQIAKRVNPQIAEISAQVVTDKNGDVLGKMCSYNKLNNGVPIEMVPYEDDYVWSQIDKLLPELKRLGHRGPLNIQGRWTDNGLRLYEMNARFTGITGWRALMGFNEVETCIKNWLDIDADINPLQMNYNKFGIRQTADKAIELYANKEVKTMSLNINKRPLKSVNTLFITGSGGYLGQTLIKMLQPDSYEIVAFDLTKEQTSQLYASYPNVKCVDLEDLNSGRFRLGEADFIIHCGFARPHCTKQQIAESLAFTNKLFGLASLNQVPAIINISSQAVYGTGQPPLWTEQNPAMPETVYGQAKYASELMAQNIHLQNRTSYATSLRLASLTGGQQGLIPIDIIAKFVNNALQHQPIVIQGGTQKIERIDVRDAAAAICELLKTDYRTWKPAYNVGNIIVSVLDLANTVQEVASRKYGLDVQVTVEKSDVSVADFGMDCTLLQKTGWAPKHNLEDIIVSLFEYLNK